MSSQNFNVCCAPFLDQHHPQVSSSHISTLLCCLQILLHSSPADCMYNGRKWLCSSYLSSVSLQEVGSYRRITALAHHNMSKFKIFYHISFIDWNFHYTSHVFLNDRCSTPTYTLQIIFYFLFVLTVVPMVVINCHAWLLHFLVLFIEMILTFSLFGRKHFSIIKVCAGTRSFT